MKKILNGIEIELTSEEIAQRQLDEQQATLDKQLEDNKLSQQESKKQSAIAKLKALGLDEEEIKSLLGV
jgi:hypothetical protein